MIAISALATAVSLFGLLANPSAAGDTQAPLTAAPTVDSEVISPDPGASDNTTNIDTIEQDIGAQVASREAGAATIEEPIRLTVGASLGPGAWGPNIGISIKNKTHVSLSYLPIPVLLDNTLYHHGALRVARDIRRGRFSETYLVSNLSFLLEKGQDIPFPFLSLGVGIKGKHTHAGGVQPFAELKAAPFALMMTANQVMADPELLGLFILRPTVGMTWTF